MYILQISGTGVVSIWAPYIYVGGGVATVDMGKNFLCFTASKLALGSIHPPIQWRPRGDFLRVKEARGVKLITQPRLVPRPRIVKLYLHSLMRLRDIVLN
jgi:hypothetical protein